MLWRCVDVMEGGNIGTLQWQWQVANGTGDALFCQYSNMNMLVLTETGTMGTIMQARYPSNQLQPWAVETFSLSPSR